MIVLEIICPVFYCEIHTDLVSEFSFVIHLIDAGVVSIFGYLHALQNCFVIRFGVVRMSNK